MDLAIKNTLTNIEKGFNFAGCLPVVSLFSGALRMLAGKIQAVAGAVMAGIGFIGHLATKKPYWKNTMNLGAEFVLHGALNVLRGFGEAALSATTVLGNLFLFIPNMAKRDKFSPYIPYGSLTEPEVRRARYA